jgi:hypothetical protein
MDDLCNLLNNHYEDIRPDLAQSVFSAIHAGQIEGEFDILPDVYNALHLLINQLADPEDYSTAITTYMMDINTRYSVTRPFFRPYTAALFLQPLPPSLPSRNQF